MTRLVSFAFAFVAVGCGGAETQNLSDEMLEEAARLGLSACIDDFNACTDSSSDCIAALRACIDGGGSATSCDVAVTIEGDVLEMSCVDDSCTCVENGAEVGTCADDACAVPGGCCDEFFGASAPPPPPPPPAGGIGSCNVTVGLNGVDLTMECTDGDCVCSEDGVEVGTCLDDTCAIPGGCCDDFFTDVPTPPTGGTGEVTTTCASIAFVDGDTLEVACSDGTCTCTSNDTEVGQCDINADACAIPGSCCDAFF